MKSSRRNILKAIGLAPMIPFVRIKSINENGNPECITSDDIQGPFYIEGAPKSQQIASENAPGTKLFITGTVYFKDCKTPISGAEVDVWQANDAGGYDDNDYRGIVTTSENGSFSYQTILPGKYLNGAQFRPRHLHYKVRFGGKELTTQIYFDGDTSIEIDPWASQDDAADRIIPLTEDSKGAMHGVSDIFLDQIAIINGMGQVERQKSSSILFVGSDDYTPSKAVHIHLKEAGIIDLFIYDINGRPVATLVQQKRLSEGEHSFQFVMQHKLDFALPSGIYIARLQMNGKPSDAKRFFAG